jgi:hypothetical protein
VCVVDLLARVGGVRRSGRARACLRMRCEWNALVALLKVVLIHTVYPYKMYPWNVLVSRFTDDATGGTRAYASRMDVLLSFSYSFRFPCVLGMRIWLNYNSCFVLFRRATLRSIRRVLRRSRRIFGRRRILRRRGRVLRRRGRVLRRRCRVIFIPVVNLRIAIPPVDTHDIESSRARLRALAAASLSTRNRHRERRLTIHLTRLRGGNARFTVTLRRAWDETIAHRVRGVVEA